MLNLRKIAITGGVASGKSSVCLFFKECGAYVVNADHIVHALLSPNTSLGIQIISLLGEDVVENNQFNRKAIAEKVFKNYTLLKNLEDLLHPEVQKDIEKKFQSTLSSLQKSPLFQSENRTALFVAEVPLLFESRTNTYYDEIILVVAKEKDCQKRFEKLHDVSSDEFLRRTSRLITLEEKMRKADRIIYNEGTLADLKNSTQKLYHELTYS